MTTGIPHGPLSSTDRLKLTELTGLSVLLTSDGELWSLTEETANHPKGMVHIRNHRLGYTCSSSAHGLTYLGERQSPGSPVILAPEGGWKSNPFGDDRRVWWKSSRHEATAKANELVWWHGEGDDDNVKSVELIEDAKPEPAPEPKTAEVKGLPDIETEGERIVRETYKPAEGGYLWTDVVGAVQTAIAEERARHATPASPPAETGEGPQPGGWLIRESDGGWLWTGTRVAATAALTEGHEVVALSALSAQPVSPSEGEAVASAAKRLLDACVIDFGDPAEFEGDDGAVATSTEGDCAVTFKHMRDLADALYTRPSDQSDTEMMRGAFDYVCSLLPSATRAMDQEADTYVISCMVNVGELRHVRELRAALAEKETGQ